MKCIDLSGSWKCRIRDEYTQICLPGTLDENGIGFQDDPSNQWCRENIEKIGYWKQGDPIVTRLTRKHTFEGEAEISRTVDWDVPEGRRIFVETERSRHLRLYVNGKEATACFPVTLSAPSCFEVTGMVTGHDVFTFLSDNSYPGWPKDAIEYSSAASDETQTNWNGLLGYVRIRCEKPVFFSDLRIYPRNGTLDVCVSVDANRGWTGRIRVSSDALAGPASIEAGTEPGCREFWFHGLPVAPDARKWDLEEGFLYDLTVSADGLDARTESFGLREFGSGDGHLILNGRRIFLRSEANCAVFPETGHEPMDMETWTDVLKRYRSYGVNCMRFHSHCPPQAAFDAADRLGMLMQPELSHWDPSDAFGSEESRRYYRDELMRILQHLANHPSFVMLTLGNELQAGPGGHACMDSLLDLARRYDGTRLYANGSNTHYGQRGTDPHSGFFTAAQYRGLDLRAANNGMKGWLNEEYPNACRDYEDTVAAIRRETDQPVFSFEVGQYEILPDPEEIGQYRGVTIPGNLVHIREKAGEQGEGPEWRRMTEATGESSLLCYRAEVEAALRTGGYSGISLLGLQDFPGQGTALVGMMDAHLNPKPGLFAGPERFAAFFRDVLPLVLLERYTYTAGETLSARVRIANYGKKDLCGKTYWELSGKDFLQRGVLEETKASAGYLSGLGLIRCVLHGIRRSVKLMLTVSYCGQKNEYPVWVYPDSRLVCPEGILECRAFDEQAREALRNGGTVYLSPDSTEEAIPNSVQAQFSPDFWSVCTFPHQSGCMGQLIDKDHPLFRDFPTDDHNDWQWWPMSRQRAMILPEKIDAVIAEMDSYAFLRPMAKLFECRCGNGKLLVSSLGLQSLQSYPEARALLRSVYSYLISDEFSPQLRLSEEWIDTIFKTGG